MSVTIKDKLQVQGTATSQLVLQVGGGCPSNAGGQREMSVHVSGRIQATASEGVVPSVLGGDNVIPTAL